MGRYIIAITKLKIILNNKRMKKKLLIAVVLFALPITMLKANNDNDFTWFGHQSKDVENRDRATWTESDINGLTAEDAPLGEGIALLIAGGLGYGLLKRKGEKE